MEYSSQVFDDMLSLAKFLNHNKIPPQNIVKVLRNTVCYGTVEMVTISGDNFHSHKGELKMEYKSKVFDDIHELAKFLNHQKIPSQNIIAVHRNTICYGYETVELLYMVESKDPNRNPFLD